MSEKIRAGRNRTLILSEEDKRLCSQRLINLEKPASVEDVVDKTIRQDAFEAIPLLPESFIDLCFVDPPYNLTKNFNGMQFKRRSLSEYADWFESWVSLLPRILKPTASIYICSDWRTTGALQSVLEKYFVIRNRITWEREKGRGAISNWKNCLEDIWYCTVGNDFHFDAEAVKVKRRVVAPYTTESGKPKDWMNESDGQFRLTCHSNLWTDLTVPFWSMPENTDHPTQKPEKLVAKIILASSKPGDIVFDPFLGSGTTSVTAKKLGRRYVGIEADPGYACTAEKRLEIAEHDSKIQGFSEGVFWERNSLAPQKAAK